MNKSGEVFKFTNKATEMDSVQSERGGYQRINLSKL